MTSFRPLHLTDDAFRRTPAPNPVIFKDPRFETENPRRLGLRDLLCVLNNTPVYILPGAYPSLLLLPFKQTSRMVFLWLWLCARLWTFRVTEIERRSLTHDDSNPDAASRKVYRLLVTGLGTKACKRYSCQGRTRERGGVEWGWILKDVYCVERERDVCRSCSFLAFLSEGMRRAQPDGLKVRNY